MRLIFALIFVVGIGIAGFAVYMTMQQIGNYQAQITQLRAQAGARVDLQKVVITTQDLKYGDVLNEEHVKEIEFPKASLPDNAFTSLTDLLGEGNAQPRQVSRTMEAGELVLVSKVTRFGQDAGIVARLEAGKRAFTINVDAQSGVSGFIKPGSRVDIYWSGNTTNGRETRLLIADIEIIAVDQSSDEDTPRARVARTVTVQGTPQLIANLAEAQNLGKLQLSLRGIGAETAQNEGPVTANPETLNILVPEAAVSAPAPAPVCTRRIRRGDQVIDEVVPCK